MKAIIESLQHLFQQPRYAFQSSLIASSSIPEGEKSEPTSRRHFFVAKDFSKQASYFFRVEGSQEYESEVIEKKDKKKEKAVKVSVEKKVEIQEINYSVGIKSVFKLLVFPLVFCWIILETAFEFIIDSDEGEGQEKKPQEVLVPKGNYYLKKD